VPAVKSLLSWVLILACFVLHQAGPGGGVEKGTIPIASITNRWKTFGLGGAPLALQPGGTDGSPLHGGACHGQMGTVGGPPRRCAKGRGVEGEPYIVALWAMWVAM